MNTTKHTQKYMNPNIAVGIDRRILGRYIGMINRRPNSIDNSPAEFIVDVVSRHTGISYIEMQSKLRTRVNVIARQLAMTLILEHTSLVLKAIGKMFGGRDHSTVLYAKDTIADLVSTDKKIKELYEACKQEIERLTK